MCLAKLLDEKVAHAEDFDAFAGEKWAFLVRFLGAEVSAVSVVPCWGCAEVMAVSVVPCRCVLCANSPCEALMRA